MRIDLKQCIDKTAFELAIILHHLCLNPILQQHLFLLTQLRGVNAKIMAASLVRENVLKVPLSLR